MGCVYPLDALAVPGPAHRSSTIPVRCSGENRNAIPPLAICGFSFRARACSTRRTALASAGTGGYDIGCAVDHRVEDTRNPLAGTLIRDEGGRPSRSATRTLENVRSPMSSQSRRRSVFTRSSSARMRHNAGGVQQQARSSRLSRFDLLREFDTGSRKPRCAVYSWCTWRDRSPPDARKPGS
jgi:hypothetical protein